VTEKVDLAGLEPRDVAVLGFPAQLVLLKTVAHSLRILHDLDIVHSDLKPSNVMIKRTELGYTTKLIDFDSSYVVGSPPPPEEIVGTMNYYSPELVSYIQGTASAADLTQASDMFALGPYLRRVPHRCAAGLRPAYHEARSLCSTAPVLRLGRERHPMPSWRWSTRCCSRIPPRVDGRGGARDADESARRSTDRRPGPGSSGLVGRRPRAPAAGSSQHGRSSRHGAVHPGTASGPVRAAGKGLRITSRAASPERETPPPSPPPPASSGALLGKLVRAFVERRPR
jgi:serine/threonine protein kinase